MRILAIVLCSWLVLSSCQREKRDIRPAPTRLGYSAMLRGKARFGLAAPCRDNRR